MYKSIVKQGAIRFRRFSRQAYAAFCSMHREVTIGRISHDIANMEMRKAGRAIAMCGFMMIPGIAFSEDDSPDGQGLIEEATQQVNVPEVLVLAEKSELQSSSYRLVTSVSAEEIATLPITTVADILNYLPGVDVRTRGANGSQADISMRGGTFDQVLVMINGVNLTDSQTGHYSMNLPVSTDLIDHIEVLEGTSANLFGLNAFSGAINIVTKSKEDGYNIRMTGGMNGLVNPALAIRQHKGEWYINTSAEYNRADGYYAPDPSEKEATACSNSDYKIANIYLQTGYKGLDVQIGAQYKDAGAGMFYGFGSQDQFDATRTAFGSAAYSHTWGQFSLDAQASYRAQYDRYEWHRGQRKYGNFHFTQNAAASLKGHYASRIGRSSVGIEVRNENIHSTNLGDTINPEGQVPNVEGFDLKDVKVLDLVYGCNRFNINYFVEQSFIWEKLSASLGLSGNYNTMFGNNFAGGANIGYQYAQSGNVYLNANRSLRLPTFTDLYYNAGNQLGSRELKPEEAWTLDLGTKYAHDLSTNRFPEQRLSLAANTYFRWGKNIIDWVYTPEDTKRPYHATNQNQVNTAGMEASISYHLNKWLPDVSLSYAYTWMNLDLSATGSRYLDYLKHHFTGRIEHGIAVLPNNKGMFGASWCLTYKERMGQYNNAEGEVCDYTPILLLDGSIYYRNDMVKVSVDCTNMTNRHYYDYGGILQPGAWAKATVSIKLK